MVCRVVRPGSVVIVADQVVLRSAARNGAYLPVSGYAERAARITPTSMRVRASRAVGV